MNQEGPRLVNDRRGTIFRGDMVPLAQQCVSGGKKESESPSAAA